MHPVLMIIGGTAHPFESCASILKTALEVGGQFALEITQDRSALADPSSYDAVILYTFGGELTADQEQGLVGYVRGGGGLVAIHCANAKLDKYGDYTEMVGTVFITHGPVSDFTVETSPDAASYLPRLTSSFDIMDEFYVCERRTQAELRVFQEGLWQFERHHMGYVRDYGQGRVLYTALGHDERAFNHPDFQDLIFKGLRYVMRQEREETIRVGLLGYGPAFGMGTHHSERIADTQGLELAAICDRDSARLEAAKEEQGEHLATFTDASEMAASGTIDLGIVVLPHAYHAMGIRTLLEAGIHVVTEKPFAVHVADCDEVIALARERGVMLSVYHNRHWDSDVLTLLHIIESGRIGEVYSMECAMMRYARQPQWWRSHKEISGGTMYDMGAHQFEKVLQLVPKENSRGEPINRRASLYGHSVKKLWHDTTNEDYVRAYARFDGGVEAQVKVGSLGAAPEPLWTVLGTHGAIVIDDFGGEGRVSIVDEQGHRLDADIVPVTRPNGYYKNMVDHLQTGVPLIITPEWAKGPIQCIEGCETAARENRVVEVEFDF